MLAAGVVSWLAAIITPAISFDVDLAISSEAGLQFRAYFQILSTILFLLAWKLLERLPIWTLAILALCSALLFVTYSIGKDYWSCVYMDGGRYIIGGALKAEAATYLATEKLLDAPCLEQMSHFGGDGLRMWQREDIVTRFLVLFGTYSLAWLTLALLVAGAARHGISRNRRARS